MNAPLLAAAPARASPLHVVTKNLPRLAADTVQVANLVHSSARALEFELCEQRLRLSLEQSVSDWPARWSLSATRGAAVCAIEIDGMQAVLPGVDLAASGAANNIRCAIAAQLLASAWAALGLPLPEPAVQWQAERGAPAGPASMRIGIRIDNLRSGARTRGRVCFASQAAARGFAAGLARLAGCALPAALAVEIRFDIGKAKLTARELRALEPGDVILHSRLPSTDGRWRAVILAGKSRTEVAIGHVKGDSIVTDRVQLSPAPASARNERSELLDAVSVELGFEIGRSTLRLSELLRLSPGYVFELGAQPEGDIVDLTLNGASVGIGQLVLVGEALGVRVVRLQLERGDVVPEPETAAAESRSPRPAAITE